MLSLKEKTLIIKLLKRERRRLFVSAETRAVVKSALAKLEQNMRNIKVNKLDKERW